MDTIFLQINEENISNILFSNQIIVYMTFLIIVYM